MSALVHRVDQETRAKLAALAVEIRRKQYLYDMWRLSTVYVFIGFAASQLVSCFLTHLFNRCLKYH